MHIGELFHVAHVVDDLRAAETWYDDVFAPSTMFRDHDSAVDRRMATLLIFADYAPEPMTAHPGPEGAAGTIGRFRSRFGEGLHSLAFYCDSVGEWYDRWRAMGIRVNADGGAPIDVTPHRGAIYTHPRDTFGMVELMEPRVTGGGGTPVGDSLGDGYDPRLRGEHDASYWERQHPLGIRRTSHLTVLVDDVERAADLYAGAFDALPFHDAADDGGRSRFCTFGTTSVVELAQPAPGTEEAESLRRNGAMLWSVTFLVRDLDAAEVHLRSTTAAERRPDGLRIEPSAAFGARYRFTDQVIPGDPR